MTPAKPMNSATTTDNRPETLAFQGAYWEMKRQIDGRRFGVHERLVLRLVNDRSFGRGRAIAEIPYLDYFVKYSIALGAGVMARPHVSVAVNRLKELRVLHCPGRGRYMFNVLFDGWLAPLLPDAAAVLHEMDLLPEPPDLYDGLMLNFLQSLSTGGHRPPLQNLPAPGTDSVRACHPGQEAQSGDDRARAEDGHYREPARPSSGGGAGSSGSVTKAGVMPGPKVTDFVTPPQAPSGAGNSGAIAAITKNVTLGKQPAALAHSMPIAVVPNAVTDFVTTKAVEAEKPAVSAFPPLESPLITSPLLPAETHNLITSLCSSLANKADQGLFLEVAGLVVRNAVGRDNYLRFWRKLVGSEPDTVRRLLSELRNTQTPGSKPIGNPGGWMGSVYFRWRKQRRQQTAK